jgi:hypothetical protein
MEDGQMVIGDTGNGHKVSMAEPQGKSPLDRPGCRRVIKWMLHITL